MRFIVRHPRIAPAGGMRCVRGRNLDARAMKVEMTDSEIDLSASSTIRGMNVA
jgi:hypothetical protein